MSAEKKDSERISSGNGGRRPGAGRPKGAKSAKTLEIEAAAKAFAGDALAALRKVALNGKSEGARVMAAVALLDRAYGRPRQALQHSGLDGAPLTGVLAIPIAPDAAQWAAGAAAQQAALVARPALVSQTEQ